MTVTSQRRQTALVALCLVMATAAVYWPVHHFDFVNYDDPLYVTENVHVQAGLTLKGVAWAFTTHHFSIWAPLLWLSCMLDCQLFGLNAGAHHVVNVLLHVANTLLLFLALKRMTGALWRSAFVAALFALHPLHVESVAWVSERKDALSTLFWMLTMLAYVSYVETPMAARYAGMLGLFIVGLLAKPMLVTLPFVLLLLDFWPLKRTGRLSWWILLREKLPLILAVIPITLATYWAEERGGSVVLFDHLPMAARFGNAAVSYVRYLGKTFWPTNLSAYYPYQHWPATAVVGALAVLLAISVAVIQQARRRPQFVTGWFWYLGTLVPVIGLVQVGSFSLADRYTYVPLIGIFIMVGWAVPDAWMKQLWPKLVAAAVLIACAFLSAAQVRFWQNSETLFRHALLATGDSLVAHENLGKWLAEHGRHGEAAREFTAAIRCQPASPSAHNNLASSLAAQGQTTEAITEFRAALQSNPGFAEVHYNLGVALAAQGKMTEAMAEFTTARQLDPDNAKAHYNLGALLASQGRLAEAIVEYREAVRLKPDWTLPLGRLAWVLATGQDASLRNGPEAVPLAERFCRLTRYQRAEALNTLAAAYAETGRFPDAVKAAQQAIDLAKNTNLAPLIQEQLRLYEAGRPYHSGSPAP